GGGRDRNDVDRADLVGEVRAVVDDRAEVRAYAGAEAVGGEDAAVDDRVGQRALGPGDDREGADGDIAEGEVGRVDQRGLTARDVVQGRTGGGAGGRADEGRQLGGEGAGRAE